jgi:hypothetical protein
MKRAVGLEFGKMEISTLAEGKDVLCLDTHGIAIVIARAITAEPNRVHILFPNTQGKFTAIGLVVASTAALGRIFTCTIDQEPGAIKIQSQSLERQLHVFMLEREIGVASSGRKGVIIDLNPSMDERTAMVLLVILTAIFLTGMSQAA